ncbi:UNVERIFIED_CONTAM: hypothetical protein Slati_2154900 [Sesamum latifolium]|uniref:GAG-pre-integrase domain-containing protein n=1 Tax=Sesamum latifolium TaxID=2727402 RepID=A0AAW2WRI3_9LAMI
MHFAWFEEEMAGMASKTDHNRYVLGAWIVDTGATRHMCGDVVLLHSLTPINPNPIIHLPNSSVTKATHVGTAQLTDSIVLAEVLHIPSFQYNLLFVSQLYKALPICFIFHNSSFILQDRRTEEALAIGSQIGKLFYLTPSSFSSTAINKRAKSVPEFVHLSQYCTSYELWQKRLGHPSENVIDHISTLICKKPREQSVCSVCPLAKQSRKSFP